MNELTDGAVYEFCFNGVYYYGRCDKFNQWFSIANKMFMVNNCSDISYIGMAKDNDNEQL